MACIFVPSPNAFLFLLVDGCLKPPLCGCLFPPFWFQHVRDALQPLPSIHFSDEIGAREAQFEALKEDNAQGAVQADSMRKERKVDGVLQLG